MIAYKRYKMENGLRVVLHRDMSTPLVTVNMLYMVGSRDERPERTGFAHLFEHLMFGGTPRVSDFDAEVDDMGGESNAFTNTDYTNYYMTVPAEMLERALKLEADRLTRKPKGGRNKGRFSKKALKIQQKVVTEEYHQRYENQPYGDTWLLLRPLCYERHPYRWCTIGADIKHVQHATMEEVEQFFDQWYRPDNAILAIAGNMPSDEAVLEMVAEAFESSATAEEPESPTRRHYPTEPEAIEAKEQTVRREVPSDALYMAWNMCDRYDSDYYVYDTVSDLLSNGHSSRMYRKLVQEEGLFAELNAYITGELGPGLFVVSGKLNDGISFAQGEAAIAAELRRLAEEGVEAHELEKVANKFENTFVYSQYKAADRALSLCYYEMIGEIELTNSEPERYRKVSGEDVKRVAAMLNGRRCRTLRVEKM